MQISEPGLYDLPAAEYHADPVPEGSLSQSRAKVLLQEAGPARFKHLEAEPEHKPEYDLGTAAHAVVLGKGAERLVLVDAKDYKTKAAQEQRDAAYAEGLTPVLPHQMQLAEDMAAALAKHPRAMEVLSGQSEVAAFYRRPDGLWLRGQMDKYAPGSHIGDYKTCADASSRGITAAAWKYGYYIQAPWYRRLVLWLTGESLPYRLVFQEKTAPFLVSVWEVPADYLAKGEADMDEAISIYQQCVAANRWPGYPDEIQTLSPPDWALDDEIEV